MKTRNGFTVALIIVIGSGLMYTPVLASSKQQHRWEGIAIGVGAALVAGGLIKYHRHGPGSAVPGGAAYYRTGKPHRHMTWHRGTCPPRYGYHLRHRNSQHPGHAHNWRHYRRVPHLYQSFNRGHRYWQAHDGFYSRERNTHLGQRRFSRGPIAK